MAHSEHGNEFIPKPNKPNSVVLKRQKKEKSKRTQAPPITDYIHDLQQRNQRLKIQIAKIRENIKELDQKDDVQPYKLITVESTSQSLRKQLQNAYKQIGIYQKEIQRYQEKQSQGPLTQKMSKLQTILQDKTKYLQRLNTEVNNLIKNNNSNSKKLKDNSAKQEIEASVIKLNDQIKYLRQKVKESEIKQKRKLQNSKKQQKYIRSLQQKILAIGGEASDFQAMKNNNIFAQIFQKNLAGRAKSTIGSKSMISNEENEIKTIDRYQQLKNQIKLYKKLHFDYQKKLQHLKDSKQQAEKQLIQSQQKILQKDKLIEDLQIQVKTLKTKVNRANLKPIHQPSQQPVSDKGKKNGQNKKEFIQKMKSRSTQQPLPIPPHLKFDEKGLVTQKGTKFSDRPMLAKMYNSRIITVKIWVQKTTFAICGIQLIYLLPHVNKTKLGGQYIKNKNDNVTELKFQCSPGDYIKNISGAISNNNVIDYLVFISRQSKIMRFGAVKPNQKQFSFDIDQSQLPICLYGAYQMRHDRQLASLTFLGFQIAKDQIPPPI